MQSNYVTVFNPSYPSLAKTLNRHVQFGTKSDYASYTIIFFYTLDTSVAVSDVFILKFIK
jgi:hypothetical protein